MLVEQNVRQQFYHHAVVKPVATLASLRDTVLSINEKRCPKWRFRLTPEVVLHLQPRPNTPRHYPLFEGIVIQGPGITRDHFEDLRRCRREGLTYIELKIEDGARIRQRYEDGLLVPINEPAPGQWTVWPATSFFTGEYSGVLALKELTLAMLPQLETLHDALMFYPACMLCGKRLTDPVSLARWIGPECAHNHTLDVGLFKLN
jgi:hypothetical protein